MRITEAQLRRVIRAALRESSQGSSDPVEMIYTALTGQMAGSLKAIDRAIRHLGIESHAEEDIYAYVRESLEQNPLNAEQAVSLLSALQIPLNSPEADEIYQKFDLKSWVPSLDSLNDESWMKYARMIIENHVEAGMGDKRLPELIDIVTDWAYEEFKGKK